MDYFTIAAFSVSPQKGLFYLDSSFRPVPLEQHFLGIRGKPGTALCRRNFDRVVFEKVSQLVAEGHQVMVFVHARKETVKSALTLREMAVADGNIDDFSCQDHPQWALYRRRVGESKNVEMKRLFDSGFGIHHAGMLRSDRTLTEELFQDRVIKVCRSISSNLRYIYHVFIYHRYFVVLRPLHGASTCPLTPVCSMSTLAVGVSLEHIVAVIIKGTQVYDSSRGAFVDLSVLDVLQIFGRAGRPGLESSGTGYICTTEDKLTHYLDSVLSQVRDPLQRLYLKLTGVRYPSSHSENVQIIILFPLVLTHQF